MGLKRKARIFHEGVCCMRGWHGVGRDGWVHVYGVRLIYIYLRNRFGWHETDGFMSCFFF